MPQPGCQHTHTTSRHKLALPFTLWALPSCLTVRVPLCVQANFAWQERVDVEKEEKEQLRVALQERVDAEKVEKEQLRSVILEMQAKLDMHAANRSAAAAASASASSSAAQVCVEGETNTHHTCS